MSIVKGYHGTSLDNAKSIITTNFRPSKEGDEYLGSGVYFFIDGLCCPIEAGKQWAISKHAKNPSLIEASIELENSSVLDLRNNDHVKKFNMLKDAFFDKLKQENIVLLTFPQKRKKWEDKCKIANFIIETSKIDIAIKDEYFPEVGNKVEQEFGIQLKVSNCTIMNVANPNKILNQSLLEWE
ncbi:hypothetical protein [Chromobacterium amazonense]|uniref:hypothetical protein n=1 Tax=Chromobacterium amazonense TaxID=1382803 RepID=UPI00237DFF94|nr:hypothetical protein [Chromobacterium amazonense]MDE1712989.1 hypothetical protein [Chromobacterium amazonense]